MISISLRSIMVCRIVDVTSPLHVPIAIRPAETAAIPITLKKDRNILIHEWKEGRMDGREEGRRGKEGEREREGERKETTQADQLTSVEDHF